MAHTFCVAQIKLLIGYRPFKSGAIRLTDYNNIILILALPFLSLRILHKSCPFPYMTSDQIEFEFILAIPICDIFRIF